MKVLLLLAVCVLSFHNGKGAPRTAVYKFVKCNPEDDDANCVAQRTQAMEWSPDLPAKLPASAVQYLEAEPVEDESPAWREEEQLEEEEDEDQQVEEEEDEELQVDEEEEDEEQQEEEDEEDELDDMNEKPVVEEESESPVNPQSEAGSGGYEGSTGEVPYMDEIPAESGSGESWTEKQLYKVGDVRILRRLFPTKAEEQDLKQDHLLQL